VADEQFRFGPPGFCGFSGVIVEVIKRRPYEKVSFLTIAGSSERLTGLAKMQRYHVKPSSSDVLKLAPNRAK
jgi:hypothetical protein